MKHNFSDRFLKSLKPASRGKRDTFWDANLPSFGLRVTEKRRISFFVMRRPHGSSQPVRVVLGPYPLVSLAKARERARATLDLFENGTSPREMALKRQQADQAARSNTFARAAEDFIARYVSKKRTAVPIQQIIRTKLVSRWGDRPVTDVSRRDVIKMLEELVDAGTPFAASQTLIYTRRLFNWAITRDAYGLTVSPCDRIRAKDHIGTHSSRTRVLTETELRLLWQACEPLHGAHYPYGPFLKLLLITGVRRSELAESKWSEFDLENQLWTIGAERMKNNCAHTVSLSPLAMRILSPLPRFTGPFLFSTTFGVRPIAAFSKIKQTVDGRMAHLASTPIPDWRLHDLRRTVRTNLARLGVSPTVAELVIGHKQRGIAAVYDLHLYENEKRAALDLWAKYLETKIETIEAPIKKLFG